MTEKNVMEAVQTALEISQGKACPLKLGNPDCQAAIACGSSGNCPTCPALLEIFRALEKDPSQIPVEIEDIRWIGQSDVAYFLECLEDSTLTSEQAEQLAKSLQGGCFSAEQAYELTNDDEKDKLVALFLKDLCFAESPEVIVRIFRYAAEKNPEGSQGRKICQALADLLESMAS